MIQDVTSTLKQILTKAPGIPADLAAAAVIFDRPTEPFTPTQTTVDLFLYDIRENLELRNYESTVSVNNGVATFVPPPLRVACSYLITAWPVGGTDLVLQEQQLLAEILQVLAGYPIIPSTFLQGNLVGQAPPLPMVTLHPDSLRTMSEFWTSLGTKMRASLTVTVTISMNVLQAPAPAPIVVTHELGIEQLNLPATHQATYLIAGAVVSTSTGPAGGANVSIVEAGRTTTTDAAGNFSIGPLAAGTYTIEVQSGATKQTSSITVPATTNNGYNVQLP